MKQSQLPPGAPSPIGQTDTQRGMTQCRPRNAPAEVVCATQCGSGAEVMISSSGSKKTSQSLGPLNLDLRNGGRGHSMERELHVQS